MFSCIYCFNNPPEANPSTAHLFPDGMGGVSFSNNTVCKLCNELTNKAFEQIEIKNFSFFQSVWGIKNRRGRTIGVPADLEFQGKKVKVTLDENGVSKSPLVFVGSSAGNISFKIVGDYNVVREKKKEIDAKYDSINWKEVDFKTSGFPDLSIKIPSDLTRKTLRRLAAKVAYERWGQLRNAEYLNDQQYTEIRNFILTGTEDNPICGLLCDRHLLNTMLNFPIGNHAVMIIAHPKSAVIGAFVSFYGMFYFWVILSKCYKSISPFDDILIEDPQNKERHEPIFRSKIGNLLIHWDKIAKPYFDSPNNVNYQLVEFAKEKFNAASDEFYNLKK